jgi:hypothetical protein
MGRTLNRLNATQVKQAKEPGMYADGGGLYLRVAPAGTKSWIFRFAEGGKLRDMGLGSTNTVSLARARQMLESVVSCANKGSILLRIREQRWPPQGRCRRSR